MRIVTEHAYHGYYVKLLLAHYLPAVLDLSYNRIRKAYVRGTVFYFQTNGVTAVTAVTPIKRPYPISAQVPSRFTQGNPRAVSSFNPAFFITSILWPKINSLTYVDLS